MADGTSMIPASQAIGRAPLEPPLRPEFEHKEIAAGDIGEVQTTLSVWERVRNNNFVRKAFILAVLASVWELYARFPPRSNVGPLVARLPYFGPVDFTAVITVLALSLLIAATVWVCLRLVGVLNGLAVAGGVVLGWGALGFVLVKLGILQIGEPNPLMFPQFSESMVALWEATVYGPLLDRVLTTLSVLFVGYGLGLAAAGAFTALAITTRFGRDLLETLTSMFNPLPAIALLPLALLWFGLGRPSLWFVIVHSVMWAVALNTHSGFMSVSETQRMAGQNYGLKGLSYVGRILVPAAFASILAGLKIGWAFAWRTLIAAELVFGVSSRSGGLGWFIFENRNQLETAAVFAGLITVIIIGLLVENVVFRTIEAKTVRRWGMQR